MPHSNKNLLVPSDNLLNAFQSQPLAKIKAQLAKMTSEERDMVFSPQNAGNAFVYLAENNRCDLWNLVINYASAKQIKDLLQYESYLAHTRATAFGHWQILSRLLNYLAQNPIFFDNALVTSIGLTILKLARSNPHCGLKADEVFTLISPICGSNFFSDAVNQAIDTADVDLIQLIHSQYYPLNALKIDFANLAKKHNDKVWIYLFNQAELWLPGLSFFLKRQDEAMAEWIVELIYQNLLKSGSSIETHLSKELYLMLIEHEIYHSHQQQAKRLTFLLANMSYEYERYLHTNLKVKVNFLAERELMTLLDLFQQSGKQSLIIYYSFFESILNKKYNSLVIRILKLQQTEQDPFYFAMMLYSSWGNGGEVSTDLAALLLEHLFNDSMKFCHNLVTLKFVSLIKSNDLAGMHKIRQSFKEDRFATFLCANYHYLCNYAMTFKNNIASYFLTIPSIFHYLATLVEHQDYLIDFIQAYLDDLGLPTVDKPSNNSLKDQSLRSLADPSEQILLYWEFLIFLSPHLRYRQMMDSILTIPAVRGVISCEQKNQLPQLVYQDKVLPLSRDEAQKPMSKLTECQYSMYNDPDQRNAQDKIGTSSALQKL